MLRLEATIADVGLWLGGGSRDRVKPGLLSLIAHFKVKPRDRAGTGGTKVQRSPPLSIFYMTSCMKTEESLTIVTR